MRLRNTGLVLSVVAFASFALVGCGDDAGGAGGGSDAGAGGEDAAPSGATTTSGSATTSASGTAAATTATTTTAQGGTTSTASGEGGSAGEGGGGQGGGGSSSTGGECSEGYEGADCKACAAGYQDDDMNGTCELGCDAEGDLAPDCGAFAACFVLRDTGERQCACDEGHAGADCATCAPGYAQDAVGTPCELDLPSTASLKLWLDASASATLGVDGNLGVNDWDDRRGSVVGTVTAPSAAARPRYVADALGGQPIVRFEGPDELQVAGFNAMQGADYTILAVVEAGSQTGDLVSRRHPEFAVGAKLRRSGTSLELRHQPFNEALESTAVTGVGSVPRVLAAVRHGSSAPKLVRMTVRADGDPLAFDTFAPAMGSSLGNMGGSLAIGTSGFVGDVAEVLIYDRALPVAEVQRVQEYFVAKYDLE